MLEEHLFRERKIKSIRKDMTRHLILLKACTGRGMKKKQKTLMHNVVIRLSMKTRCLWADTVLRVLRGPWLRRCIIGQFLRTGTMVITLKRGNWRGTVSDPRVDRSWGELMVQNSLPLNCTMLYTGKRWIHYRTQVWKVAAKTTESFPAALIGEGV